MSVPLPLLLDPNAGEASPVLFSQGREPSGFESADEALTPAHELTIYGGPLAPAREQLASSGECLWISLALVLEPGGDCVFRFEVRSRRICDDLRRRQPAPLPLGAPLDHPRQYSGRFGLQLIAQFLVAFTWRDRYRKWDEVEPSTYGLIHRSKARLVVAGDDQFEGRCELEEVLPHEPG